MAFILHPYAMLMLLFLAGCNDDGFEVKQAREIEKREAIQTERQNKLTEVTQAFQQKYNADPTWEDTLTNKSISTYDLQQSLIRRDDRPIFAAGTLFNIEKRGNGFVLFFHIPEFEDSLFTDHYLTMELKCPLFTEDQAQSLKLQEFRPWDDPDYLIAARLHNVSQSHQFLRTASKEPNSISWVKLRVEHIATGECVGLEPIGSLFAEYEDILRTLAPVKKLK